ncbi:MAG: YbjN domain-containing protein [Verrucomicrobia bacterium]|nr:YbjN domain-containing protein [Verrucomicrobiota bacterium]
MKVNEHNFLASLKKMKIEGKVQQETNQVYAVFHHEKKEYPIFLRSLHEGELLQFLTFIPCYVEQSKVSDMARFLHMLNKELDMPGFCIDEGSLTVFYRLVLPTLKKEYNEDAFEAFINTSQTICKSFATVIEALAIGAMTLEEIIKKAHELRGSQVEA